MLGTRPGAGPSKRETSLELLLLYGDAAVSQWPSEVDRREWLESRSDKEARDAAIQVPEPASRSLTSATDDTQISGDSWLNTSASVSSLGNQTAVTNSTCNGETQHDNDVSTASNCTPLVVIDSDSSTEESTETTRFTQTGIPPVQNLEVPNRALSPPDGSTSDTPIAGSSIQSPSRSTSHAPSSQIASDSQFSESNHPIDLCLPKIVPREPDLVDVADSDSSHDVLYDSNLDHHIDSPTSKKLSDVSDESLDDVSDSQRPSTPRPGPNMSENYHYQQGVPPSYPPFMVMGATNYPPGVVMVGENYVPLMVIPSMVVPSPVGSFVYPTWQPETPHMAPNIQQYQTTFCQTSHVVDENELEQNRGPKIIELEDDDEVEQNESIHEENNSDNSDNELRHHDQAVQYKSFQKGNNSDNSDAECVAARKEIMYDSMDDEISGAEKNHSQYRDWFQDQKNVKQSDTDEPRPGPSGVVYTKPLSSAKAEAVLQHLSISSEQNSTSTVQSQMRMSTALVRWSSPAVKSSQFHTCTPPAGYQLLLQQQSIVEEKEKQQRTDEPQLSQSLFQETSPPAQLHISSNQSYILTESNHPSLMLQTTESLIKPCPVYIQEDKSHSQLLQKQFSHPQLPLPQSPGVDAQAIQLPTTAEQKSDSSVKSVVLTDRLLKSPLEAGPSCTSVCTTVDENVSCNLPSSLPSSTEEMQISIQFALPIASPAELSSDQAEYQPVTSTVCEEQIVPSTRVTSPIPSPTQELSAQLICLEPFVMSPSPTQNESLQDPPDDTAATRLSSFSTSSSAVSPSQPHSPQLPTSSPPASSQLLVLSPREHRVQSPSAAVEQDCPLQNIELSMSLLSPHSPKLNGVAIKSKAIVKRRSREPWDHKGLIRFIGCYAFSLPRHIWTPRREGEPRRSARIAEKMKAQRYFLRPRSLTKTTGE